MYFEMPAQMPLMLTPALKSVSVAEDEHQLAVDIQHAGGFDSEVLDFGIGIGVVGDLLAGDALDIHHEDPLGGEENLVTNGLEALDNVFPGNENFADLRANLGYRDAFQVHQIGIAENTGGYVGHNNISLSYWYFL